MTKGPRVDSGLHYQYDFAATMIEMLGGRVPGELGWRQLRPCVQGRRAGGARLPSGFAGRDGVASGGVRFDDYMCVRSYHDGYHALPDTMLFDIKNDPHEQKDLARQRPEVVGRADGHAR